MSHSSNALVLCQHLLALFAIVLEVTEISFCEMTSHNLFLFFGFVVFETGPHCIAFCVFSFLGFFFFCFGWGEENEQFFPEFVCMHEWVDLVIQLDISCSDPDNLHIFSFPFFLFLVGGGEVELWTVPVVVSNFIFCSCIFYLILSKM